MLKKSDEKRKRRKESISNYGVRKSSKRSSSIESTKDTCKGRVMFNPQDDVQKLICEVDNAAYLF